MGTVRGGVRCATTRIGAGFDRRRKIALTKLLRQIGQQHLAGALLSRIITFGIDEGGGAAYHRDVALNSAAGIGVPVSLGEQAAMRLFLFACARARLLWRAGWGSLRAHRFERPARQPRFGLPPPIGVEGGG